jgi:hypothetical protein
MPTCNLSWVDSDTPSVTGQQLTLTVNGTLQPAISLSASATSYSFACNFGDAITASLVAISPGGTSTADVVSGTAPPAPPTPPDPPTGLAMSFA